MNAPLTDKTGTATRILDIAQRIVQMRGFNAFSYADVAEVMNVTKASLHYHFPSKAILGEALIQRYIADFRVALASLERNSPSTAQQLYGYASIYQSVLADHRCCFCCMLSADYMTLPPPMQAGVRMFFTYNRTWLSAVLDRGKADGELDFAAPTEDVADFIVAALEGAMLTCWVEGGAPRFARIAQRVLAAVSICPPDVTHGAGPAEAVA